MIKLPIPVLDSNSKIISAEIKKPRGGVLADTSLAMESGNVYKAMQVLLQGCISKLEWEDGNIVEDSFRIKQIVGNIPYKTAEFLCIQIFLLRVDDDGVDAIYECPRCGHRVITEKINDFDTRDHISDLEIQFCNNDFFTIKIDPAVEIVNKANNEPVEIIDSITMRHPTLNDCIKALGRCNPNDKIRLQYNIWAEALTKVNGNDIDNKYRNRWGTLIFEYMEDEKAQNEIAENTTMYGFNPELDKICSNCGKQYKAVLPTASFFSTALK
jgi:hypothetical protein